MSRKVRALVCGVVGPSPGDTEQAARNGVPGRVLGDRTDGGDCVMASAPWTMPLARSSDRWRRWPGAPPRIANEKLQQEAR